MPIRPSSSTTRSGHSRPKTKRFQAPSLGLPEGFSRTRLSGRMSLLECIDHQRAALDALAASEPFDRYRQAALSLLTDAKVKEAFDVVDAEPKVLDRYGRHAFGWSLLMARRLVEAGVNLVQVNLGNNETWDTHGNMFPHLKEKLFPPTDQALSALLDDLHESGLLDSTLIVMAGEFGRTPRISTLPEFTSSPAATTGARSRPSSSPAEEWSAVESSARPTRSAGSLVPTRRRPRTWPPRSTRRSGLPATVAWHDAQDRPHFVYRGEPIAACFESCAIEYDVAILSRKRVTMRPSWVGPAASWPTGICLPSLPQEPLPVTDRPQSKSPSEPDLPRLRPPLGVIS